MTSNDIIIDSNIIAALNTCLAKADEVSALSGITFEKRVTFFHYDCGDDAPIATQVRVMLRDIESEHDAPSMALVQNVSLNDEACNEMGRGFLRLKVLFADAHAKFWSECGVALVESMGSHRSRNLALCQKLWSEAK
jgi:hypothetical protein